MTIDSVLERVANAAMPLLEYAAFQLSGCFLTAILWQPAMWRAILYGALILAVDGLGARLGRKGLPPGFALLVSRFFNRSTT